MYVVYVGAFLVSAIDKSLSNIQLHSIIPGCPPVATKKLLLLRDESQFDRRSYLKCIVRYCWVECKDLTEQ